MIEAAIEGSHSRTWWVSQLLAVFGWEGNRGVGGVPEGRLCTSRRAVRAVDAVDQ